MLRMQGIIVLEKFSKNIYILTFLIYVLIGLLCTGCSEQKDKNIIILYTGNANGKYFSTFYPDGKKGGLAKKASIIKEIRRKNKILLLDAGNSLSKSINQNEHYLSLVGKLNYDALALKKNKLKFIKSTISPKFPFINAFETDKILNINPYIIKNINDLKIAITGIDNYFEKHIEQFQNIILQLKKESDLLILLYFGTSAIDIVQKIKGIDLLINVNDSFLDPFYKNQTLLVKAREEEYIGKLSLIIRGKHNISNYKNEFIFLDNKILSDFEFNNIIQNLPDPFIPFQASTKIEASSISCIPCHKEQYQKWKNTKHAIAYKTLKNDKRYSFECLKCHTTTVNQKTEFIMLANVECSACHNYKTGKPYVYKDNVVNPAPGEKNCRECHTKEWSPKFDFNLYRKKIIH